MYFISNLVLVSACVNWQGSSAFGIYIFIYWYFLIFSYKLTVLNGLSLMVWKCIAVTFSSSSFEWGEGRGGGRTSAKVGLSAKFELTCRFMLCFTEGLFVLHTKDLISGSTYFYLSIPCNAASYYLFSTGESYDPVAQHIIRLHNLLYTAEQCKSIEK